MSALKIVGIVLIVLGIAGLAYGGFSYMGTTHSAKLGSMEMSVTTQRTVNVPLWAGIGAIVVGAGLLLVPGRKS